MGDRPLSTLMTIYFGLDLGNLVRVSTRPKNNFQNFRDFLWLGFPHLKKKFRFFNGEGALVVQEKFPIKKVRKISSAA